MDVEPKTYWEKRCAINEVFGDQMFDILAEILPTGYQHRAQILWDEYVDALDRLDKEHEET